MSYLTWLLEDSLGSLHKYHTFYISDSPGLTLLFGYVEISCRTCDVSKYMWLILPFAAELLICRLSMGADVCRGHYCVISRG